MGWAWRQKTISSVYAIQWNRSEQWINYTSSFCEIDIISCKETNIEVSYNGGTPKSSILIQCSLINHPFLGIPTLGTLHLSIQIIYPRLTWYSEENAGFQISHDSRLYKSFRRHVSRRPQLQCEGPQWCERWFRFAPEASSLFAYHVYQFVKLELLVHPNWTLS